MANDKITIRASKQDIETLNNLALSLSVTKTALLKIIINSGIGQTVELTNPDLLTHFHKIEKMLDSMGNNVNQIARKLNSEANISQSDISAFRTFAKNLEVLTDVIESKTKRITTKKSK